MGKVTRQENRNKTRTKKLDNGKFMGMKSFENGNITRKKKTTGMENSCKYFYYRKSQQHPDYFYKTLLRAAAKITGRRYLG